MQVSMREFKTHLSKYIHQAHAGQTLEITNYKQVIVKVMAVEKPVSTKTALATKKNASDRSGEDLLLAANFITWNGQKPKGASIVLSDHPQTMADLVLEQRN